MFGYRKKVVFNNLRKSFPEKSEAEIRKIAKGFYRQFCDFIVESIKSLTISANAIKKRCRFQNPEYLQTIINQNRSIIGVLGHFGNWEWAAPSFCFSFGIPLYVVYNPLSNKYFDELMFKTRSKFGPKLIPMQTAAKEMFKNRTELNTTILVADQTPHPDNAYWMEFMNQDTPVLKGPEILAKKFNLSVVFVSVRKVKRGYYEIYTELITENPLELKEGQLTILHTKKLEEEIKRQPELWLWSHKRWKHVRNSKL